MAAITGATTTTSLTEIIPTEQIGDVIGMPAGVGLPLHNAIADIKDASGPQRGPVYTFPRWNETATVQTEASPFTEADDGGFGNAVEQDMAEATATAVVVGIKKRVTYQAMQDAPVGIGDAVRLSRLALRKRLSQDLLLNVPDCTNSDDYSGLALTRARLGASITGWKGQDPVEAGLPMIVLHTDQMGDFRSDLESTNATLVRDGNGADLFTPYAGFQGMYQGFAVFESSLVAAHDGSNWSGCILKGGSGGALGIANWWSPGVLPDVFDGGVMIKVDDNHDTLDMQIICAMRYGTALVDNGNIREVISQT